MKQLVFRSILCASALCSAPALFAQMGGMSDSGSSNPAANAFLHQLSSEEQEIVSLVDAMPADKFSYAPTAGEFKGVRTFGDQAKHITQATYYFFGSWGVAGGKTESQLAGLQSKADIEQALKDSFAYARKAMMTINASNAFTPVGKEGSTRAGMAASYLAHQMDHYGQMVVYLRLNGIVPPASRRGGM
jgi:uncharacterized damage-inducible protein DinB